MKKLSFFIVACIFACHPIMSQPVTYQLYENSHIPNSKTAENLEKTEVNNWGVEFTTATSVPTLTYYPAKKPNGKAVIICPGGGYWGTAGDHEGRQVARALNKSGISTFVLKYRVPDARTCIDPSLAPLQDAQQAIRTVRKKAAKWGIKSDKIGIMGFSAGGHLAATAATHFLFKADTSSTDTTSARPDFAILVYPVISFDDAMTHGGSRSKLLGDSPGLEKITFFSNELHVAKESPPVFLVHAQDDNAVPVTNSIAYYMACTKAGVPATMHLYPAGGHGFGMVNKTTKDKWMDRLTNWIDNW